MLKRLVMVAAFLLGCGDSGETEKSLDGYWVIESANGCLFTLAIDGDDYETGVICELESGRIGIEKETGNVAVDGDSVTVTPERSSCRDGDASIETWRFDFVGDQLRLTGDEGVLLFEDGSGGDGDGPGGAAIFGCYDADGGFTESPVADL